MVCEGNRGWRECVRGSGSVLGRRYSFVWVCAFVFCCCVIDYFKFTCFGFTVGG